MKNFTSIALTALISLLFMACSKSSPEAPAVCGTSLTNQRVWDAAKGIIVTDPGLWSETTILTSANGNERAYMLQLKQEHLCTRELAEVVFQVNTTGFQGTGLTTDMLGRAEWGEGKSKETYFCTKGDGSLKTSHEYKTFMPVDLKSEIQGDATMRILLTIRFNSLGSVELDNLYFRNKYQSITMRISGHNP